jgi:hypothetical protein
MHFWIWIHLQENQENRISLAICDSSDQKSLTNFICNALARTTPNRSFAGSKTQQLFELKR